MRQLNDHKVPGTMNADLTVRVVDLPGASGANHYYVVNGFNQTEGLHPYQDGEAEIYFQEGPIVEAGINGLTHEVLLAIVIDRLRSFQAGPYACEENKAALGLCVAALRALKERTKSRIARGVEGTRFV